MHSTRVNRYEQLKKKSWLELNSIKKNESYVTNLLSKYGFKVGENCEIVSDAYGDYGITLNYQSRSYRIEVDSDSMEISLLGYNNAGNCTKKNKYHCIKRFSGNDILIEILNFVKNIKLIIN